MFWVPVAGAPGTNQPPMASYPMSMMPPSMVSAPPSANTTATAMPIGTPPAFGSSAMNASNTQSGEFTVSAQNASAASFTGTPVQRAMPPPANVPMQASLTASTSGDGRPMYVMNAPSMPVGYAPVMTTGGYMPVGAVPMVSSGTYYHPMAVYPTLSAAPSGDFSKSASAPVFVTAAPNPASGGSAPMPFPASSGCFTPQASGDFTTAVSFGSVPAAFSGTFAPQTSSGVFHSDSSGHFRQSLSRAGKSGDAGRGYEAGVYYEGRVKRFNPVRGYGFLSATHKLVRVKDLKESQANAAAAAAAAKSMSQNESVALAEAQESEEAKRSFEQMVEKTEKTTSVISDNATSPVKNASSLSLSADATSATNVASAQNEKPSTDIPLINVISVTGAETDPEINMDDLVIIKGEEYVRKPVTMGDIFVHYHCLQRTPAELESEQNGALVNLPAGARVQFKAEVFVPAKLMEEAQDSKQAAAMLNNIGIPVDEDPNLLAGAIATKKGWGYQAMNVVQLPALTTRHGSRRGLRGKARSVGNASTASLSSVNSARHSTASSQGRSEHGGGVNALAPCSGKNLNIHVSVETAQPPPPSFESATAGMKYVVPPAGGLVYYPTYPSAMPM